jgi:hypothetical protein
MKTLTSAAISLAAGVACLPADPPGAVTLELGSSEEGFVPLPNDGAIALHAGVQGGFHVYLAVRTTGIAPGSRDEPPRLCDERGRFRNPCIDFDVVDLDTGRRLDAFVGLRLPLSETSPGVHDLVPPRLVTLAVRSLDEVDGHRFRVSAEIGDASGRRLAREVTATCAAVRPVLLESAP